MTKFENLFSPLNVGNMLLRNRIIASPLEGGDVSTDYMLSYLAERSACGAALIMLSAMATVEPRGAVSSTTFGCREGISKTTKELHCERVSVVHSKGAKVSLEIMHAGYWASFGTDDEPRLGPSDAIRADGKHVRALTVDDMNYIAEKYAETALEAKLIGYDMVTLHFAHGWLPAQFLTPYFNKRTDEYGGNIYNRAKFPLMIIDRVREKVGKNFPLDIRISGDEFLDGGNTRGEIIEFLKMAEDKLNMINVSAGQDSLLPQMVQHMTSAFDKHCANVDIAEGIKKEVKIPVSVVGAINTPQEAEDIIKRGCVDAVTIGRQLTADPLWGKKALNNEEDEIVPCLRCYNCYKVATLRRSIGCSVNPRSSREHRVPPTQSVHTEAPKNVVVIGGGPAGLKAAITAQQIGHKVVLLEKESELGGLIRHSDFDPKKADLRAYKNYLLRMVEKSGLEVRTNVNADVEYVRAMNPDAIIAAIGSEPRIPKVIGIDKAISAVNAYKLKRLPAKAVIIGGGMIGAELALFLNDNGTDVTVVEITDRIAGEGNVMYREALRQNIEKRPEVKWLLNCSVTEVLGNGVHIKGNDGEREVAADTVIYATGYVPLRAKAQEFMSITYNTSIIGDCYSVATISEATHSGYFAALNL